jgi:hypothetical protein
MSTLSLCTFLVVKKVDELRDLIPRKRQHENYYINHGLFKDFFYMFNDNCEKRGNLYWYAF